MYVNVCTPVNRKLQKSCKCCAVRTCTGIQVQCSMYVPFHLYCMYSRSLCVHTNTFVNVLVHVPEKLINNHSFEDVVLLNRFDAIASNLPPGL